MFYRNFLQLKVEIQQNFQTQRKNTLNRAVIRSQGPGISLGQYECGPWLLLLENRRKIEPKEIPSCLIPHLLVVFTRQLEILVTSLFNSFVKNIADIFKMYLSMNACFDLFMKDSLKLQNSLRPKCTVLSNKQHMCK